MHKIITVIEKYNEQGNLIEKRTITEETNEEDRKVEKEYIPVYLYDPNRYDYYDPFRRIEPTCLV